TATVTLAAVGSVRRSTRRVCGRHSNVKVVSGADKLGMYKRNENQHRQFCTSCGAPVLVRHPSIGMTDVPAGSIMGFTYKPTLHVHYGEKVMAMRDGLPKFKDFPKEFGGSGDTVPEERVLCE